MVRRVFANVRNALSRKEEPESTEEKVSEVTRRVMVALKLRGGKNSRHFIVQTKVPIHQIGASYRQEAREILMDLLGFVVSDGAFSQLGVFQREFVEWHVILADWDQYALDENILENCQDGACIICALPDHDHKDVLAEMLGVQQKQTPQVVVTSEVEVSATL